MLLIFLFKSLETNLPNISPDLWILTLCPEARESLLRIEINSYASASVASINRKTSSAKNRWDRGWDVVVVSNP